LDYGKYFPIEDYYRKVVIPINSKRFKVSSGGKMVCPLHDDHDPSLGIITSKKGETCHCFGCGAWLDVVDLHSKISKKYFNKYLSREESRKDLCRIFDIPEGNVPDEDATGNSVDDGNREDLISDRSRQFNINDFRYMLLDGKLKGRGIGYFNALMMSMIWEVKAEEAAEQE
jgi:hypothetical protein